MPFITEELYQSLSEKNESIMFAQSTIDKDVDVKIMADFENAKEIITNIRNIRASKNISPKMEINVLYFGEHKTDFDEVIKKLANVGIIEKGTAHYKETEPHTSFFVGTTEYTVPIGKLINAEEEIAKMEEEINYLQGCLKSVGAKLSNEKFVANAKPEIVENERKKQADAESKIASLKESIAGLRK
jgi:valyl-tRNA synthetase